MIITVQKKIDEVMSNTKSKMGISTGIAELDSAILGLRPQHLIVIAGFSGIGKSSIMVDLGLAAAKEAPVALFTIEMGTDLTIERMNYSVAGLNYHGCMGKDLGFADQLVLDEAKEEIKGLQDIIIDEHSDTIYPSWLLARDFPENSIENSIKEYAAAGCKVMIIDYLQILQYGFRIESETLRIKAITGKLHRLAIEYNLTVIALAQLKKDVGDRLAKKQDPTPTLSDIRDSGFIINDADIIMLLHRPEYFEKKGEIDLFENRVEDAQIIIGKQRNGPVGSIDCTFHAYAMSFKSKGGF